jgi:hypothetical protein
MPHVCVARWPQAAEVLGASTVGCPAALRNSTSFICEFERSCNSRCDEVRKIKACWRDTRIRRLTGCGVADSLNACFGLAFGP